MSANFDRLNQSRELIARLRDFGLIEQVRSIAAREQICDHWRQVMAMRPRQRGVKGDWKSQLHDAA